MKALMYVKLYWETLVIILVPLLLLPLVISGNKPMQCAYVVLVVAIFWITEVLNLPVTSLIPIVLFPTFGILTPKMIAACYMKDVSIMLIGGLIVAKTVEKQKLHKRLALGILKIMGPNPAFQYFGFMFATWFLSMWISNTATAAMMVTLAEAVAQQWRYLSSYRENRHQNINTVSETIVNGAYESHTRFDIGEDCDREIKKTDKISKGLFLSVAYAAACGGIATIPGTGANIVFYGYMEERYGSRINLNFSNFMLFTFPISVINVLIAWMLLSLRYIGFNTIFKRRVDPVRDGRIMKLINQEYIKLGNIKYGEISTLIVFILMVLLWILRDPGTPIWGLLFTHKTQSGKVVKYWGDSITAILAALLVFILPSKNPFKHIHNNEKLNNWKFIENNFSWGVVFLFGGGFALAAGCEESGLSPIIGNSLTYLKNLPHFIIIFIISLGVSFLTEVTSNIATATVLLPIVLNMAEAIKMHPLILGLSSTIACSFSFCLPAANPPNAIVFSTGRVRVIDMASSGFMLNIICVLILSVMVYFYSVPIFNTNTFPDWISANKSQI
uniref:Slc13a-7 n=1 Tax=Schmidtea mediterranea TaxID=79327 RepID=A0A0H3YIY6_SCHMD|nr:slc13a-7 [Schmidtea mediterranea]